MREILFRGQNGLGNWFYGGYVYCKHSETHNIVTENTSRSFDWFDVIHETIGQYTGLKDNNGVKIFEGDILKISDVEGYVRYYDGSFHLINVDDNSGRNPLLQERTKRFKVNGNIHDAKQ